MSKPVEYAVHSREEAVEVFNELRVKRYGWLPTGLAISFADEAKRGKINPAHLIRLGDLMAALHKANRQDVFTNALPEAERLTRKRGKGGKAGLAHLIKTLEQHVEPQVKSKPISGTRDTVADAVSYYKNWPFSKPVQLGAKLKRVDKFLRTPVSLKGVRRVLTTPISFRSKGEMPSAKEVADARKTFEGLRVPYHGVLARNPALLVALHEGHNDGLLYTEDLVGIGTHLKDLFAGKTEQQKSDLLKKLDGVFRDAERHARKRGTFAAYRHLNRTINEKALQTFADRVKQRVKGVRRVLTTPISFRSKGELPSTKEVADARKTFEGLQVPRHGILARNPALYVALHEGHKAGVLHSPELVNLGKNLRDLCAGKTDQEKDGLFKRLDGVFRKAERYARKKGPFEAFDYLRFRTESENALNHPRAEIVKQNVKHDLLWAGRGLRKVKRELTKPRSFRKS